MSYILDALKRADAERERGHVPGLHTRSAPNLDVPTPEAPRRWLPAGLIGLAVMLAVGAVGLWWWLGSSREVAAPVVTPAAAPAPPSAAARPPEPAPGAPDPTLSTLPILTPDLPHPARPASTAADRPAPPATPASAETAPAAATASTASNTTAAAKPVRSFAELTPDLRARLPAVNVSGSTYSQNPAHRMLIINGKVVQEGDEFAPGLTLETIEQRSAVLNHQGLRYRIGY